MTWIRRSRSTWNTDSSPTLSTAFAPKSAKRNSVGSFAKVVARSEFSSKVECSRDSYLSNVACGHSLAYSSSRLYLVEIDTIGFFI